MKKIAVLIAALMALGFFPGIMAAETNNLIKNNNSFEVWDWTTKYPLVSWNGTSGMWGTALSQNTEHKKTGESSLQMVPDTGEKVYVYQPADVLPGTEYTFSFWFLGMEGKSNNGNVEIAFEYRKADGKTSAGSSVKIKPEISVGNAWQQLSASTETPMECEILRAVIHVYHPGGGYVDDAELVKTSAPKYGEASTDKIFYYKEEIQPNSMGEAVVTLNPYYTPEDFKVSIAWPKADGTWQEGVRSLFSEEGEAVLSYSLEGLVETKKAYAVKAHIYAADASADADPLWTEEKTVHAYHRPLALDTNGNYRRIAFDTEGNPLKSDGTYVLENEIFQPTLAYHVSQPKANTPDADNIYLQAQNAGVNVVQLSSYYADPGRIKAALDICQQYNLMALICLYRNNVPAGNRTEPLKNSQAEYTTNEDNTKAVVEIAKHHPATFAFAVKDEPFSHMTPTMYEDLENSYKIIRNIDDVHPVYIVDTADVVRLAKYADICAIDPYPESPEESGTDVAYNTARAVAAAKGEKPVYVILQAFCYGDTDDDGTHDYFPAWKEIRHMWYQALAMGAKAVGYYAFDDPLGEIGDKNTTINETKPWEDMVAFAKAEMQKSYNFFLSSTLIRTMEEADCMVQLRAFGDEMYAVVLSKSSDAVENTGFSIGLEGKIQANYTDTADTSVSIDGSTWTMRLSPSAVGIYCLQTEGIIVSRESTVVRNVEKGQTYTAEAAVMPQNGGTATLFAAVYSAKEDIQELLYLISIERKSVTSGERVHLSGTFSVPLSLAEPNRIKVFVLSAEALQSLIKVVTLPVS